MIGQKNLLSLIDKQLSENSFPRFSIIIGERGSESDKIGVHIAKYLGANCINTEDVKVETIRTIIQSSYTVSTTTVYNIINADTMSIQAQNALLKVTEEPPNKAYFIMTFESDSNILPTIKSRGSVYSCDMYSSKELISYAEEKYSDTNVIFSELCNTPGEVDILHSMGVEEFYSYTEKVVDNISEVSGSNAFKIANKIKFKDTDEGYDILLFWKAFRKICFDKGLYERVRVTSIYLNMLRIKSLNRSMLFDKWILEIRRLPNGDN